MFLPFSPKHYITTLFHFTACAGGVHFVTSEFFPRHTDVTTKWYLWTGRALSRQRMTAASERKLSFSVFSAGSCFYLQILCLAPDPVVNSRSCFLALDPVLSLEFCVLLQVLCLTTDPVLSSKTCINLHILWLSLQLH